MKLLRTKSRSSAAGTALGRYTDPSADVDFLIRFACPTVPSTRVGAAPGAFVSGAVDRGPSGMGVAGAVDRGPSGMGASDGAVAGTVPSTWLRERMEDTPVKRSRTPKVPATIKIILDLVIPGFHQYTPSHKHWWPRPPAGTDPTTSQPGGIIAAAR